MDATTPSRREACAPPDGERETLVLSPEGSTEPRTPQNANPAHANGDTGVPPRPQPCALPGDPREDADRHLLEAVGRGDHLAFELLVKRYRAPVCGFTHRILGDRQQAEDVTQEVFLKIFRAASSWGATGRVSAWIFKIAYNLSMNEIKRRGRWSRFRELLDLRQREDSSSAQADPVEKMEFQSDLARVLLELPENQRAALLLRVNEGLSYAEIATVLSVSLSAVESLIWRARTRLRERLGDHRE